MATRRDFIRGLAGLGLAGLAAACRTSSVPAAAPPAQAPTRAAAAVTKPSDTLDVGVSLDTISGDFHLNTVSGLAGVSNGLTGQNPFTNAVGPALAESWQYQDGGKVWEYKLRQGVTFHNGEPFNAASVKYSYERFMDPATKAVRRVAVAPYFDHLDVVDDYTVRFVLKKVTNTPATLGNEAMFPPQYAQSVGAQEFGKKPVGTGVYKVLELNPGQDLILQSNDNYWNKDPNVGPTDSFYKTIKQHIIPEPQTRLAALEANEVSFIDNVPEVSIKRLESTPGIKVQYRSALALNNIVLNSMAETDPKTGGPNPLRDKRVRQALNYAVDVDSIIKKLRTGRETRSNGAPAGVPAYDAARKPYAYDPARAKSLLSDAGYANGFEMTIVNPIGRWPASSEVLQAVAGYLTAVGVNTTVQDAEYAVVASGLDQKTIYNAAFWGGPFNGDGSGVIALYYRAGKGSRRGMYIGNDQIESLSAQFDAELDPTKQAELLKKITGLWFEDAGELFMYDQWYVYAYKTDVLSWDENGPPYSTTSGIAPFWELKPVQG